jgi:hypothetical protein
VRHTRGNKRPSRIVSITMESALTRRRVAALEEALHATNGAAREGALGRLGPLGFATRSDGIPEPAHPSWRIRDFFGQRKGNLVPLALLPRELWARYRPEGTRGNAVWLCRCEGCGGLTTRFSALLRPESKVTSCGCRGRETAARAA